MWLPPLDALQKPRPITHENRRTEKSQQSRAMPATIAPSGLIAPVRCTAKYWIGGNGGWVLITRKRPAATFGAKSLAAR